MVFFFGCPNPRISINIPGTTTGDIYVDSPEVYTRERLVNDRLEQEAWLRSQLAKTDELEFGIQGLTDIRSFLGISAALGIEADPLEAALKKAQAEQSVKGIKQQEEIDELNHRIKVLELLNKIKELSSEGTENTQNSTTDQQESKTNEESKGETKSEELKTADESDKSSEEKEPTIDKLYDELTKLLVEPKSISTTGAKPSPIDLFRDRLAYREELRAELIENSLDDSHDLQGNTLYRLKFDTTIFPDYDTSAWAVIEVTIEDGGYSDINELYMKWIRLMEIYINEEYIRRLKFPTADENMELLLHTINRLLLKEELEKIEEQKKTTLQIEYDVEKNLKTIASMEGSTPEEVKEELVRFIIVSHYDKIGLLKFFSINPSETKKILFIRLVPRIWEIDPEKEVKKEDIEKWEDEWNKMLDERINLFRDVLKRNSKSNCYAITPKELVQRISDVASRREATQLSLSLGLLMGSIGLKSLMEYARVTEGIFQAIRRQPLVVGFSKHYPTPSNKSDSNKTFGWIVGPRFSLRENGKGSYFRHTPVQQSLSALVSLPSWWNEAILKIKRYWKSEDGKELQDRKFEIIEYEVNLPGDILGIKDALITEKIRPPIPRFLYDEVHMEIGNEDNLVIAGTDLWRSPAVFIGSQKADRISVLPNMQGIVAHFKEIKQPAGWERTDMNKKVKVYIWTSEGHQEVGEVILHRSKKISTQVPKTIEVNTLTWPIIFDELAIMELTSGSTPKSYNDLSVGIRVYKGGTNFYKTQPYQIENKEVSFLPNEKNLPDELEKHLRDGTELELALILKESPDSVPKEFISKNRPIYYKTKEASKVRMSPLTGSNLPLKVEFTFPNNIKSAYPKFDYSNISFTAEVITHDDINLIVEKGERKDNRWPVWIKVKQNSKSKWDDAHKNDLNIRIDMTKGDSALELDQRIIKITKAKDKK